MAYKNIRTIIINTSMNLFKENGYKNVSIDKICNNCSITKPTFYYHFKSKEEIVPAYFDNIISSTDFKLSDESANLSGYEKCLLYFEILQNIFSNVEDDMIKLALCSLNYTDINSVTKKIQANICISYIGDGQKDLSISNINLPENIFTSCLFAFTGYLLFKFQSFPTTDFSVSIRDIMSPILQSTDKSSYCSDAGIGPFKY